MSLGSGGHQTDSKPASVLANKPQLREKQAKLPDPLWDKGHYRIGFRRPSQDGESGLLPCLKKTISTAESKCKPSRMNKFAERMAAFLPFIFSP